MCRSASSTACSETYPGPCAGTDVTARYRPGVHELEVGGDWYQVIPLADGRLAFSVGDVVGRGLEAAAAMGQLRSAIAALTAVSSKPAEVLEALDRLATQVEGAQLSDRGLRGAGPVVG